MLAVEHAQGLRHVAERRVETQVLHLELIFLFEQLSLLCLQALQSAVERGERQPSKAVVGCQTQDQECQGGMEGTKENLARADGYMEVAVENGGVDFCLCPEFRPPGGAPLKHQRRTRGVGNPACDDGALGTLGRVQDIDRCLSEPVYGFLFADLDFDMAGADRGLFESVLPQLVGADPRVKRRWGHHRYARHGDTQS